VCETKRGRSVEQTKDRLRRSQDRTILQYRQLQVDSMEEELMNEWGTMAGGSSAPIKKPVSGQGVQDGEAQLRRRRWKDWQVLCMDEGSEVCRMEGESHARRASRRVVGGYDKWVAAPPLRGGRGRQWEGGGGSTKERVDGSRRASISAYYTQYACANDGHLGKRVA
jgi:hypothetical protein